MLKLFGRKLTFSVFKTTLVLKLFPRSYCSSPAASNNSFAFSYLIDSCGFPIDKAIAVSKYLKFKTPDRADSVIAFFKNQGFTETQTLNLIQKFPLALTYHPQKTLLPKFDFLKSIGLSHSDIKKFVTSRPNLLGRSLKNHIEPNYNILRDLLQSDEQTLIVIRRCAWGVLDGDLQGKMLPNMQILRDVGVPGSKMMYALSYYPKHFLVNTAQFKEIVEEVVDMGFDPLKMNFMLAVHAIRSMSKSTWEKKMETCKKWGWSESQILQAFRTYPWFMKKSEEKIDKVMVFFVNKMGFQTSFIAKHPVVLSYSLEKRIIPRCLVYQYCLDNGLIKDTNNRGFISWLTASENMFMKRLERYMTLAPGILKFYKKKSDLDN